MRRNVWYALGMLLGVPALLAGQGFGVYEHGTCTMGRSGVATAMPCADGSAIFYNPAGLAGLSGTRIMAGATLITASGAFTDDATGQAWDLDNPPIPVPHLYVTHAFSPKFTAGVGVFVPYGLETRWPSDAAYDSVTGTTRPTSQLFPGRFLGWNSKLQSIYVQPTVAYQVHPRLQLGIGVSYIHSKVDLKQRVDLSEQDVPGQTFTFALLGIPTGSDFAEAHLDASGSSVSANIGAILQVTSKLWFGARYLTEAKVDYDGTADFTQLQTGLTLAPGNPLTGVATPVDVLVAPNFAAGAPLSDTPAKTSIKMPAQFSAGLAWQATAAVTLMADYQYVHWKSFDQLVLDFENALAPDVTLNENYKDTHGFRFAAEWTYSPKLTFRGGYLTHTAAAPDETVTPLLPEGARNELTAGIGYQLASALRADIAYQYIRQDHRRGRVFDETVGNTGLYTFKAHLFGLSLAYTF